LTKVDVIRKNKSSKKTMSVIEDIENDASDLVLRFMAITGSINS